MPMRIHPDWQISYEYWHAGRTPKLRSFKDDSPKSATFSDFRCILQTIMGTLISLETGVIDAVDYVGAFLDEEDAMALSRAVLAPKPLPRWIPEQAI